MKFWSLVPWLCLLAVPSLFAQTATITWGTVDQSMTGFGASLGTFDRSLPCNNTGDFGPQLTVGEAQTLYGSGTGQAALNMLRVQVCPDGTYPDDQAIGYILAANPNTLVWASPWTPPISYTANGTLWNGDGCLTTANYQNYANYLTSWVQHENGVGNKISVLSVQNEIGSKPTPEANRLMNVSGAFTGVSSAVLMSSR